MDTLRQGSASIDPPSGDAGAARTWFVALAAVGLGSLVAGVAHLGGSPIGGGTGASFEAVAGQLSTTVPIAVAIAAAAVVNATAGAVVARWLRGEPFGSAGETVLHGAAAAVLLDVGALSVLGSIWVFRWPAVAAVHAGVLFAGWRRLRPLWTPTTRPASIPWIAWALPAVVWSVPVFLQLASPVVPFIDVLPNHVASVEHVRAFGGIGSLAVMPSPIYGPSRQFVGYVGMLSMLSVLGAQPAAAAAAGFILPLAAGSAAAVAAVARRWLPDPAGYFVLLCVPLTFVFLRLSDARATVVVFIAVSATAAAWVGTQGRARVAGLAVGLAASLYLHPLIGLTLAVTLAVAAVARAVSMVPDRDVVPAILGAAVAAAPQLATSIDRAVPTWTAAAAIAAGGVVVWTVSRTKVTVPRVAALVAACAAAVALGLRWRTVGGVVPDVVWGTASAFPIAGAGALLGLVALRGRSRGALVAASAVWLATTAGLAAVPWLDGFWDSVRFEVPKTLLYWTPWVWAFAAAGVAARLWSSGPYGRAAVVAAVALAASPIRPDVTGIDNIGEHRYAESASIAMLHAERGYWAGYPNARTILDADRAEVVAFVRSQIEGGRLRADDRVLQLSPSFQQWVRTPLDVFTGAVVTSISRDPESSGHTRGGRLYGLDRLDAELASGYALVLAEGDLISSAGPAVLRAGYEPVWSGPAGTVFRG